MHAQEWHSPSLRKRIVQHVDDGYEGYVDCELRGHYQVCKKMLPTPGRNSVLSRNEELHWGACYLAKGLLLRHLSMPLSIYVCPSTAKEKKRNWILQVKTIHKQWHSLNCSLSLQFYLIQYKQTSVENQQASSWWSICWQRQQSEPAIRCSLW